MPTPINTKRGRREGRVGPHAPAGAWPCGRSFGCGVRLLPGDREPGWDLLHIAQGLVAGKMQESREPSGMVSGSQRGFRQNPSSAPGHRCLSSAHMGRPLVSPETVHTDGPTAPLLHGCLPCGMALRALTVLQAIPVYAMCLGACLAVGLPQPLSPGLAHCSSYFCDLVFTRWFHACITQSWLLALAPVLVKPLRVCSDTGS